MEGKGPTICKNDLLSEAATVSNTDTEIDMRSMKKIISRASRNVLLLPVELTAVAF